MKFTDLFVRKPVLAVVINLVIIVAGLQAIRSAAKDLGDVLVVAIATDKTAEKMKKRLPLHSQDQRKMLVLGMKMPLLFLVSRSTAHRIVLFPKAKRSSTHMQAAVVCLRCPWTILCPVMMWWGVS